MSHKTMKRHQKSEDEMKKLFMFLIVYKAICRAILDLREQKRKIELQREVLLDEIKIKAARLHEIESEYLVKINEHRQFVDEASPQFAGSGSSTTTKELD